MAIKRGYLIIFYVVVGLIAVYVMAVSITTARRTGLLSVTTSNKNSVISLSQTNSQAKIIGRGGAEVRLLPGSYYLVATNSGQAANQTINITSGSKTSSYLNLEKSSFASVDSIRFNNLGALLNNGLSADQVNLIKEYIFDYKPAAQVVSIDASSVEPGPHNPNVDVGFTLTFNLSVDSSNLRATASYIDSSSLNLQLRGSDNSVVFDSTKLPQED